jgi:hypothetical protein
MAPGPELAMRLALIDPHDVPDEQLPQLLNAQNRQLAHQQAQTWKVMAEVGQRDPMPNLPGGARWTPTEIFDAAVDEIRAELVLTRRSAETELANACSVAATPRVLQALSDGSIDRARAIKFAEGCADLTAEQTEVLLDEVLPEAAEVTATGLDDRIARVAMALDPGWAKRRYRQAVRERRVIGYLNKDGSAVVTGQNLPADDAAAACARVDALADAAKLAGAATKIDYLRAELFLGLLDGRFHGMTESAIIAELVRLFPKARRDAGGQPNEPAGAFAAATAPSATDAAATDTAATDTAATDTGATDAAVAGAAAGVHLRIGLGTLLGIDEQPGEIAGWGPVPAPVARRVAARQRRGEWRYAVVDTEGRLLFDGLTRRRPRGAGSNVTRVRGGIVELHVPLALLTDSDLADRYPEWAGLLADLRKQYAEQRPIEQDPTARFAGRPLRRRQQTYFQRCLFRGCRRPATDCDLDHRREHTRGGATDEHNTGPGCRHDHRLKTSGGWRLVRRDSQTFVWISPLGSKHVVTVDPVAPPLPAPRPRVLADEVPIPDHPDPGPTFPLLDQGGRPLPSTAQPIRPVAVEFDLDPPPF